MPQACEPQVTATERFPDMDQVDQMHLPQAAEWEPSVIAASGAFRSADVVTVAAGPRPRTGARLADVAAAIPAAKINPVLIISPSAGRTETGSVALARALSGRGVAVVLLDLSRECCAADEMGLGSGSEGLGELLEHGAGFADIIHRDRSSRAHVVPKGCYVDLCASVEDGTMSFVIDALSQAYDILLVECAGLPPGLVRAMGSADAALILVEEGNAPGTAAAEFAAAGITEFLSMRMDVSAASGAAVPSS